MSVKNLTQLTLKNGSEEMENNITFKKALFGGFKSEDVMNYIAALTDEFHRYKKETVVKAEEAKKKISELEDAYNALLEENATLKAELEKSSEESDEPEDKSESVRVLIEGLTESMNVLIDVLSGDEGKELLPDKAEASDLSESDEKPEDTGETDATDEADEPKETNADIDDASADDLIDDIINKYLNDEN